MTPKKFHLMAQFMLLYVAWFTLCHSFPDLYQGAPEFIGLISLLVWYSCELALIEKDERKRELPASNISVCL